MTVSFACEEMTDFGVDEALRRSLGGSWCRKRDRHS
jgi:hypothetical protein